MYNVSFGCCAVQKNPASRPQLNAVWRPEQRQAARDCNSESERLFKLGFERTPCNNTASERHAGISEWNLAVFSRKAPI